MERSTRANERLDWDKRPVPDPTVLTTQALQREVAGIQERFEIKFAGYEKAIQLLQAYADKSPSIAVIEERVLSAQKVSDERFKSIAIQFTERDTRTEQTSRDSKVAVDAALQAAKEAVEKQNTSSALAIAKSEASTARQIEQIVATFAETTKGLTDKIDAITKGITDKIDDAKDRIVALEKTVVSLGYATQGKHDTWGTILGVSGLVGLIAGVMIAFAAYIKQ